MDSDRTTMNAVSPFKLGLNVLRLKLTSSCIWLERLPLVKISWLIFVLAFGVRLALIWVSGTYLNPLDGEITKVAKSLATTGVFGNPYHRPTGPTAHCAPIYPFIVSSVYFTLGTGMKGRVTHQVLNSLFSALQYSLLPAMAVECQLKKRLGYLAGLFGALVPIHFLNEIVGSETSSVALALIGLSLLTLRRWRQSDFSLRAAIVQGLCWGAGLLLNPAFAPILIGILLTPFFLFSEKKKLTKFALTMVCVVGIVLLPWTIRNYYQLGAPVFVRDNFGLEFSISNNDLAQATIDDNSKSGAYQGHPFSNPREAMKVRELGEISYNREKLHAAIDWIYLHPVRFVRLTGLRFLYFWFPKTSRQLQSVILWIITIAAIVGLIRIFQIDHLAATLFTIIWLSFPLVYYLLQSSVRYRFPIYWTFLLLGSIAVHTLLSNSVVRDK